MDIKKLEASIKKLKNQIKDAPSDNASSREIRKQLKRAQRRLRSLVAKTAMVEAKAKKKKGKAA